MTEAVIVSAVRSPIGRAFKGSLVDVRPDDLAATMVRAALDRVPQLDAGDIDDLLLGCGLPGGEQGYNMARVVALLAGLDDVPAATVTRYCASSLQTINQAHHAIKAGEADVVIAAGVECVSRFVHGSSDGMPDTMNPLFAGAQLRSLDRSTGGKGPWTAPEGLSDVYIAMGQTAENVAEMCGVERSAQDEYALRSQQRAADAFARGFFEREIVPVTTPNGTVVTRDDCPRPDTSLEKLATLQPVFRPDGTVTAGNACPLNDGAAALVVMSDTKAQTMGITPMARIVASATTGLNPEIMGLGPIDAVRRVLERANMTIDDIDLVELNEAFAAQVLPCIEALAIPLEKCNVNGGAIALGHPFGMTGARIMTTLLNGLEDTGGRYGLETMCVGGGQGMAMLVERLA